MEQQFSHNGRHLHTTSSLGLFLQHFLYKGASVSKIYTAETYEAIMFGYAHNRYL